MKPFFSIITPTYNGAETLPRAYRSLKKQSFRDFEWIIIDDGSIDGTRAKVKEFERDSPFEVRYHYQINSHKKTAVNQGVKLAKGDFTLVLDDDDELTDEALENAYNIWSNLHPNVAERLSGITGLCVDQNKRVVGSYFPENSIISTDREMQLKFNMYGERLAIKKTSIRQQYPFPENIPGYVPEGLVWARIDRAFDTLYINEVFRIYHLDRQLEKLSRKGKEAKNKCWGRGYYFKELVEQDLNHYFLHPKKLFLLITSYIRYSFHQGLNVFNIVLGVKGVTQKILISMLLLPGYLAYLKDHC